MITTDRRGWLTEVCRSATPRSDLSAQTPSPALCNPLPRSLKSGGFRPLHRAFALLCVQRKLLLQILFTRHADRDARKATRLKGQRANRDPARNHKSRRRSKRHGFCSPAWCIAISALLRVSDPSPAQLCAAENAAEVSSSPPWLLLNTRSPVCTSVRGCCLEEKERKGAQSHSLPPRSGARAGRGEGGCMRITRTAAPRILRYRGPCDQGERCGGYVSRGTPR